MAKFKVGDRVFLKGQGGGMCTVVGIGPKPVPGKLGADWATETFDVRRDSDGVTFKGLVETDILLANSSPLRSMNAVVQNALNACARNGAYDTLEIRKDPRYGNNWCIYQEGVSVRAVPSVFDTPESAKKYIREQMPAWADAKIRVKNACGTARNEIGDFDFDLKGAYQTARKLLAAGAKHVGGYRWSIPGDMQYGTKVVAEKVGGTVRQLSPDKDRAGFVVVEITDPLALALERKGVVNARNSAYTNYPNFRLMKRSAEVELSALLRYINEAGATLEKDARNFRSIGDATELERDYIDTCLSQCAKCLREVKDRIERQAKNVMQ